MKAKAKGGAGDAHQKTEKDDPVECLPRIFRREHWDAS